VGRWLRGVEERITRPDVEHVIDTKMRVFEQVRGLHVDQMVHLRRASRDRRAQPPIEWITNDPDNDDNTTTSTPPTPSGQHHDQQLCPVCWTPFTRVRRQRYCTDTCRKTA